MRVKRIVLIAGGALALMVAALAAAPHLIPWLLSYHRPDIRFIIPTAEKRIFITIDDAPSDRTEEILQVLRKHDVPATFFVMAHRVESPGQLQEIVAAGHALGNHLRTSAACSTLTLDEFQRDFDACAALIERDQAASLFRPPSDLGREEQISYAKSRGYQAVVGTVFPLDHWMSNPRLLVLLARWLSVSGGVLILHDGNGRGRTTAEVLDRLLPQLRAAGYSFGRFEEASVPALATIPSAGL